MGQVKRVAKKKVKAISRDVVWGKTEQVRVEIELNQMRRKQESRKKLKNVAGNRNGNESSYTNAYFCLMHIHIHIITMKREEKKMQSSDTVDRFSNDNRRR